MPKGSSGLDRLPNQKSCLSGIENQPNVPDSRQDLAKDFHLGGRIDKHADPRKASLAALPDVRDSRP